MAELTIKRGDAERLKAVEQTYLTFATGLRFMAKRRLRDADADAIIDKTIGAGITITVAGGPTVFAEAQIAIDPLDTEPLPNREVTLFYELEDGNDHTLDEGTLIVMPKVILDELES